MNWRILLLIYWLLFVLGLSMDLFMFKWEITLGDVALGIIGIIATVIISIYRFWLPRYPFALRFYDKPWDTEDEYNPSTDCKIIHCNQGEQEKFFIRLQLRTPRITKTIDIPFLERHWWFIWSDAKNCPAKIVAISDQEKREFTGVGQERIIGLDNKKGGREATYKQALDGLPRGAIIWYEVTVLTERNWNGWLSFQLRPGSSHNGHARASLCFHLKHPPSDLPVSLNHPTTPELIADGFEDYHRS